MKKKVLYFFLFILSIFMVPAGLFAEGSGASPNIFSVIPFAIMLLSIAVMPVVAEHWWHKNRNKLIVSLVLGIPVAVYIIYIGRFHDLEHQLLLDYIPFITLLAALFYVSGGIVVKGDIPATPLNNTIFLAIGAGLASFIGTTGASMLLIRPLLKSNSERKHVVHTVVFFIFLVSNIGGLLTPLGDPPLFLGYLKGVPFTWTFGLAKEWIFMIVILLGIYYIWDTKAYKKESGADIVKDETFLEPIQIKGQVNFIWVTGVILIVAFVNENYEPFKSLVATNQFFKLLQVPFLILMMILSSVTTRKEFREENKFTFYPITEVAYLFIGIFITMIPALILLKENGSALGVSEPWQYFIGTGLFSSFLDNAPTYLVFLSLAQGNETIQFVLDNLSLELAAISLGAVFMGANTYIGNAPNFMVKSIAEENRVAMPNFGKYMLYSFGILTPLYALVVVIFLL